MSNHFIYPSEWFMTDDDCLQHCRCHPAIDPQTYELVQINSFPGHLDGKPFFQVAHAHIDVKDYSDEDILSALNFFGYEDMDDFVLQNSPAEDFVYKEDGTLDRENSPSYIIDYQLIAEMLFETDAQEYAEGGDYFSWNEAVARVAQLTGLDLTAYHKQEKDIPTLSNDSLVFGTRREGEDYIAFICTPAEIAQSLHVDSEKLAEDIIGTCMAFGDGVAASYEGGKYSFQIADNISQNPRASADYIAWSLQEMKKHNKLLISEFPSQQTRSQLFKLLAPILEAGVSNVGENYINFAAKHFIKENQPYLNDLSEIYSSFGLMSVSRERASVTQGSVTVTCAGVNVVRYGDTMFLQNKDGTFSDGSRTVTNAQHHGPVIGGWGSIRPDQEFIKSALVQYPERIRHALGSPDLFKEPLSSLDEQIQAADARKDIPASAPYQQKPFDKDR